MLSLFEYLINSVALPLPLITFWPSFPHSLMDSPYLVPANSTGIFQNDKDIKSQEISWEGKVWLGDMVRLCTAAGIYNRFDMFQISGPSIIA